MIFLEAARALGLALLLRPGQGNYV